MMEKYCGRPAPSIKPNRIPLSSQAPGKLFLHDQCFYFRHWFQVDMLIETRPQVCSVFLNNPGRKLVAFFVHVSGSMLHESFGWSLTGHSNIKTLQHTIELRISGAEPCVLCENFLRKLNYVNAISHRLQITGLKITT